MRILLLIIITSTLLFSCKKKQSTSDLPQPQPKPQELPTEMNTTIVDSIQELQEKKGVKKIWDLRAELTQEEFNQLEGAELERVLIRPIYSKIFDLEENDSLVIPQLTEGQKLLYFFRQIDETMTEGNAHQTYQPSLIQQIPDNKKTIDKLKNKDLTILLKKVYNQHQLAESTNARIDKNQMQSFKKEYIQHQKNYYSQLEEYIRNHPKEFVKFKD